MRFALFAPLLALPLASAFCHDSLSCAIGGSDYCNKVCVREGNPKGGRCLPRDGCPGNTICACYPKNKRSAEVIDGDASLRGILKDLGVEDAVKTLEARDMNLDKRSLCCSLGPWSGACCEAHCDYIGKPGGQCSDKDICTCN